MQQSQQHPIWHETGVALYTTSLCDTIVNLRDDSTVSSWSRLHHYFMSVTLLRYMLGAIAQVGCTRDTMESPSMS